MREPWHTVLKHGSKTQQNNTILKQINNIKSNNHLTFFAQEDFFLPHRDHKHNYLNKHISLP